MKNSKYKFLGFVSLASMLILFYACSKTETATVSEQIFSIGTSVSTVAPLTGSIKGTMLADSTYYIAGDVTINKGDTLLIQRGVKIYFQGNYSFIIRGSLIALGTKDKQIYFTVKGQSKQDVVGQDPLTDPAYQGLWGGLLGDTTTPIFILKWVHVEFTGGKLAKSPVFGIPDNSASNAISPVNPNGIFVMEDSWVYGGQNDVLYIQGGNVHIMRNTFEKSGFNGGESINFKAGSVGNVAYNLIIGSATNGIKMSNSGGINPQCNIAVYNNTILNCGYRQQNSGRGGSINFEKGAKGLCYNNLIVNCRLGLRVTGTGNYFGNSLVVADTANLFYGNNYFYGDSASVTNQFYPVTFITRPQQTDIPAPTFLPAGYKLGDVYDGSSLIGKNDPQFVNYPLPQPKGYLRDVTFTAPYDFHLKSTSPAIGKGFKNFSPINTNISVESVFGATSINLPSADIGAFPSDGTGNQH